MRKLAVVWIMAVAAAAMTSCSKTAAPQDDSPTSAYKRLYAAVKKKDTAGIKQNLTKKTISFADFVAQKNNTPLDQVFSNGFTATTFSDTLPETRDERVKDNMGAVEVWNTRDSKWEDLPFILEDGTWKLAVGDIMANTYKSPGEGRAQKELEAANTAGNNVTQIHPDANKAANAANQAPKPKPQASK